MQTVHEVWENGVLISSTTIEVPDPDPPSDPVRFDAFADNLEEALDNPMVNSIAEFRDAIREAIAVGRAVE